MTAGRGFEKKMSPIRTKVKATVFPSWTNAVNGAANLGYQTNIDMNCM